MLMIILVFSESRAEEMYSKGHATAYCLKGKTASGIETCDGICAMNKQVVKEQNLMGKSVTLYKRLPDGTIGEEIGTYIIADTGCSKNVIDVWRPDLESCQKFMNLVYEDNCQGKIFYKILKEEYDERGFRQSIK